MSKSTVFLVIFCCFFAWASFSPYEASGADQSRTRAESRRRKREERKRARSEKNTAKKQNSSKEKKSADPREQQTQTKAGAGAEVPPEKKSAHFKQQISKTPDRELSSEDKAMFIKLLDILSSVPRGRWVIENAPSDLKFRILTRQGYSGFWSGETVFIKRDNNQQDAALTLAHEMTHAIQHHKGVSGIPLRNLQEVLVVSRLAELHALMEQARVDHQFSRKEKGSRYDWAIELAEEKKKQGLSPEAAARFARTEMVKYFWQNHASISIPINGKEIRTSRRIDHWNRSYNRDYFRKDFIDTNASSKNFDRILRSYIQIMEVDIKPEFFLSPETSSFRLQKNKLTTYLNGIRRQELHMLDEGKLEKEYKNGELLYIRLHPQNDSPKDGDKTFSFAGGHASYSVRNGEINGIYREYDARGKQVLEVPMEEGHSEGDGWQLKENGERKVIHFRFREVFPHYRSKKADSPREPVPNSKKHRI